MTMAIALVLPAVCVALELPAKFIALVLEFPAVYGARITALRLVEVDCLAMALPAMCMALVVLELFPQWRSPQCAWRSSRRRSSSRWIVW